MLLEIDVQPCAACPARFLDGAGNQPGARSLPVHPGATTVSRMKAWAPPSQATFTNPVRSSPFRAQTQPRLRRSTWSRQFRTASWWPKAAACSALTSLLVKGPRHS